MKKEYTIPSSEIEELNLEDAVFTSGTTGESTVKDINNFFGL